MDRLAADALIFDLDGTVWDSAGWYAEGLYPDDLQAREAARRELVLGGNIISMLAAKGVTRQRMISKALERRGPPPLFDGMAAVLAELRARSVPLGVATSLPGTIALPMLQAAGLSETFGSVVHAGVCRRAKPDPACIRMVLAELGQPARPEVYYVGDRGSDAETAARAQISSAWVRHGYEKPEPGAGALAVAPADILAL